MYGRGPDLHLPDAHDVESIIGDVFGAFPDGQGITQEGVALAGVFSSVNFGAPSDPLWTLAL